MSRRRGCRLLARRREVRAATCASLDVRGRQSPAAAKAGCWSRSPSSGTRAAAPLARPTPLRATPSRSAGSRVRALADSSRAARLSPARIALSIRPSHSPSGGGGSCAARGCGRGASARPPRPRRQLLVQLLAGRRPVNTIAMSSSGSKPERRIIWRARSTMRTGSPISRTKISPPSPIVAPAGSAAPPREWS